MTRTGRKLRDPEALPEIPHRADPEGDGGSQVPRDPALRDTVDPRWLTALLLAWPVLFGVALAVEPAAADPDAIPGVLEWTIATAFFFSAAAMLIGALERRRFAFAASAVAAGMMLVAAIACPATGHHAIGGWWVAQMACAGGLLGGSAYGWRFAPNHAGPPAHRGMRLLP